MKKHVQCPSCHVPIRTPGKFCQACGAALPVATGSGSSPSSGATSPARPGQTQQYAPMFSGGGYGPARLAESAPADFDGTVTALEKRSEQGIRTDMSGMQRTMTIWTFRVVRRDAHGSELPPPIPVEMRGHSFRGNLQNGDVIKIPRPWRVGRVVLTNVVYNLTTASTVQAYRAKNYVARIAGFLGGLFFSLVSYFMLRFVTTIANTSSFSTNATSNEFIQFFKLFCIGFIVIGILCAVASIFGAMPSSRKRGLW